MAALEKAEQEIAFLKKQLYGPKSERPSEEVQYVMGELFYQDDEEDTHEEDTQETDNDEPDPAGNQQAGKKKKPRRKPHRL